jgi:DNA-binding transcriptional ArsR family regulator
MNKNHSPFAVDAMVTQSEAAAELLKAIANAQRLRILCMLIEGEMNVSQLNQRLSLSQSALSQHLAVLREKNLVSFRKNAQTVIYRVAEGPATAIIQTLHDTYCPAHINTARGHT